MPEERRPSSLHNLSAAEAPSARGARRGQASRTVRRAEGRVSPYPGATQSSVQPPLSSDFDWPAAHRELKEGLRRAQTRGDAHAARAYRETIAAIDARVLQSLRLVRPASPVPDDYDAAEAYRALIEIRKEFHHSVATPAQKKTIIGRSITELHKFTRRNIAELEERSAQFAALPAALASPDGSRPECAPESLDAWLRDAAVQASRAANQWDVPDHSMVQWAARVRHRYFERLRNECAQGRDPWSVSSKIIKKAEQDGGKATLRELQAAHTSLMHAMANAGSQNESTAAPVTVEHAVAPLMRSDIADPGSSGLSHPTVPASTAQTRVLFAGRQASDCEWYTAYGELQTQCERAQGKKDADAVSEYSAAIKAIDDRVIAEYRFRFPRHLDHTTTNTESAFFTLCQLRDRPASLHSKFADSPTSGLGIALGNIIRFANRKQWELRAAADNPAAAFSTADHISAGDQAAVAGTPPQPAQGKFS